MTDDPGFAMRLRALLTAREFQRQVMRYGVVGATATITHILLVLAMVERGGLNALPATVLSFLIAFNISYFGARAWAFEAKGQHRDHLPRYFATAILGLALNAGIIGILHTVLGLDYRLALGVVVVSVPAITFLLSRYWVFRERTEETQGSE